MLVLCAILAACAGDPFDASDVSLEGRWLLSERIDTDGGYCELRGVPIALTPWQASNSWFGFTEDGGLGTCYIDGEERPTQAFNPDYLLIATKEGSAITLTIENSGDTLGTGAMTSARSMNGTLTGQVYGWTGTWLASRE